MSSLQRYRRTGGFLQLVSLIETFSSQKKQKFLDMIEAENPAWAQTLRDKMLTVDRILAWPAEAVRDVFSRLPPKNLAFAISGLKPEQQEKLMAQFSVSEKRRMDDVMSENAPKPEEVAATHMRVIETARRMLVGMELRADKLDISLIIPENIELSLEQGELGPTRPTEAKPKPAPTPAAKPDPARLQTMLTEVTRENQALKEEVTRLREQLAQLGIKKAA